MFFWTEDSMRWMNDAAQHSDYHKNLAARIARHLPNGARVFEGGCGLGHLALALKEYVQHVTAMDISPKALACLKKQEDGALTVLCGDAFSHLPQAPYDACVFCRFGDAERLMAFWERQLCKKMFVVFSADRFATFTLEQAKERNYSVYGIMKILKDRNIAFTYETFSMEFGQPLASLADAAAFVSHYAGESVGHYAPDSVGNRLQNTTDPDFPYYFPALRNLGMVVIG